MAFPIEEKYIAEAERELGVKFPPIFIEKMKGQNGGEIETDDDTYTLYPFFDKTDVKKIKRTANHIILETKNAKEWDNFPSTGIAIGDNGFGDKLVLLPTADDPSKLSDQIYIWSHETGETAAIANDVNELVK
ncbi:SMI1/KNR4 family protein [Ohtaekwangia kribbensis]|uniref:SMI1/KNR4 family protein n=1 Tax=Ohtaekwangia kribbensis TaxID=688913 RepID=A0ABW3JX93_9BACT